VTGILLVCKQESKANLRPEREQVWGVDCKFKDSNLTEEFHLKFIKETLGVHCKASNVGCRAELNRRPIHNKIIYFFRRFTTWGKDLIMLNRNDRAAVCKICILSAHSLMIERGRYFNINKKERHCPICKTGQVEDENHFILKCKRFEQIRLKFYDKVSKTLN
jgi:hypothetical protein